MSTRLLKTAMLGSALALALSANAASAGGFKVLHTFVGGSSDGASPFGGVAPAGHGGFYVATDGGGSVNRGTLTLISKKGAATVLHSFTGGNDGQNADGTPFAYPASVYGTTRYGGARGCGTLYFYGSGGYVQLDSFYCAATGDLAFPFAGQTDGGNYGPIGTATNGNDGEGGDDGGFYYYYGVVETPICQFHGNDGSQPYGGVIKETVSGRDAFFIAASSGGSSNLGTVIESDTSCDVRVLHNFAGGSDGATPYGTLLYYKNALYGTTSKGGGPGLGTVFRIDPDGINYTVLHAFKGICCGNSDGSFPHSGLMLNATDGMLYGTTINGGGPSDNGTVYKIDPDTGVETVVHAFRGSDGAHPYAGLYIDPTGKVSGTTLQGGAQNLGVVFKLKT